MRFRIQHLTAAFIISSSLLTSPGCSKIYNLPTSDESKTVITTNSAENTELSESESTVSSTALITESEELPAEPDLPLLESHLSFQGRHLYQNDTQWLVQSGSAAQFIITGTKAVLTIAGDSSINSYSDLRPRYAVYVDGELIHDKVIASPEESIVLFEENYARTAEVRVMLLSEAKYGAVGIKSIEATGGDEEQITPLVQKDLAIEFIGDSITCGFGVDADEGSQPFSTATENFCKSYAYIAAQELDADYSTVAYSGYGVISGYSSGEKNEEETIPPYYDIASRYSGYDEEWNFSQRSMDAVFINLGTNDTCYVSRDDEYTCDEFTEGYKALLKAVREKNPDAVILCTVGLMGGEETIYPLIEKAVSEFGDDRVSCFLSPYQDIEANGAGACWHPSEKTQYDYGLFAAEQIRNALANK